MKKSCGTDGSTLTHEIGHFLGLLHTHEPATGLELVNGANCQTAGDLICDTPADPNLSRAGAMNGCLYVGNFVDQNNQTYIPNARNIMSYSFSSCQDLLTSGQSERMDFFVQSEETGLRDYIADCDFFPDFAISASDDEMTITSGQDLALTYDFDNQGIDEDQAVEIFWILSQEGEPDFVIQKDTLFLNAGTGAISQTFNWQFPINRGAGNYTLTAVLDPSSTIQERDKRNNFFEIDLTVDNSQFSDVVLFPNPTTDLLKIFVRNRFRGGEIQLQVTDYMGRVFKEEKRFKGGDEFFAEMSVADLAAGLYIFNVNYVRDGESESFLFIKGD